MLVRVRLFAALRERAGRDELELELPEGARVRDALESVADLAGGLRVVMAVNREYADEDVPLRAGDELALIPPVSGGATAERRAPGDADAAGRAEAQPHVDVVATPLSLDALVARVRDPRAGAVITFQGVTREVERLEYEAYVEMARERLAAIVSEAIERHGLCAAAAEHRVGAVPLGEPSVAVAASAPHRGEAFAGARAIIDAIKAQAPIWKKEVSGEDAAWVLGKPPPTP